MASRTGVNPYVDITGATSQNYDPPALSATTDFRRVTSSTVSGSTYSVKAAVRVTAQLNSYFKWGNTHM